MTQPKLAHQIKLNHFETTRVYKVAGKELPSVTSVIGMMDKPALVPWAAKMAAEYSVENREVLNMLDPEDAIDLIKRRWRKTRDRAADFGTAVHTFLDEGETPKADDPALAYVAQAERFINDYQAIVDATEQTLVNITGGYAGTVDVIATMDPDGTNFYADWKTGKGLYFDSHAMQLVALMECTHVAKPDGELQILTKPFLPTEGWAVRLSPTDYQAEGIRKGTDEYDALYTAFIGLTDVWHLKRNNHNWSY